MLLLAPPNAHQTAPIFFHNLWEGWLDNAQDFVSHDLPRLIGVLLVAWLLIWLVSYATGRMRYLAERHANNGLARAAQIKTLASVMRATGIGIVSFVVALQILRDVFNFNLAPLLASAGVAGVAIGLAAQTIVKDMINGMLVLVEDQYNVGDVVTLAGMTGTVQTVSLRKTTVLGFDGTLYIIPNSQITNVVNQSREFSTPTVNISVDFSADPDKVIALLTKISMEVRNDPKYKDIFLNDPQILGVDSIKGSEVIYPIGLKTRNRSQYDAVRDMLKRIHNAFEKEGILPGNPYRVNGGNTALSPQNARGNTPSHDPTTDKPNQTNPFTGEGM